MAGNAWPAELGVEDAIYVVVALGSFVLLVPVQVVSMIVFDATGLDAVVPTVAFMALIPAGLVTLLPLAVTTRNATRARAIGAAGGLFVAYIVVAVHLLQFYAL